MKVPIILTFFHNFKGVLVLKKIKKCQEYWLKAPQLLESNQPGIATHGIISVPFQINAKAGFSCSGVQTQFLLSEVFQMELRREPQPYPFQECIMHYYLSKRKIAIKLWTSTTYRIDNSFIYSYDWTRWTL